MNKLLKIEITEAEKEIIQLLKISNDSVTKAMRLADKYHLCFYHKSAGMGMYTPDIPMDVLKEYKENGLFKTLEYGVELEEIFEELKDSGGDISYRDEESWHSSFC